jgi:hypothetical protein
MKNQEIPSPLPRPPGDLKNVETLLQLSDDGRLTVILPESPADEVASLIQAAAGLGPASTEVDPRFADTFYWVDVARISDVAKASRGDDVRRGRRVEIGRKR